MLEISNSWFVFLSKYIRRYIRYYILGFIFLFVSNIFSVTIPLFLKYAVEGIRSKIEPQVLLKYCLIIISFALIHGIFRTLSRFIILGSGQHIEYDIRNDIFGHLERLPMSYYNSIKTGDIMSRCTNDLTSIKLFLGPGLMHSLNSVIIFTLAIIWMSRLNLLLTFCSLLPYPFIALVIKKFSKRLDEGSKKIQEQLSSLSSISQENLNNIQLIKSYTQEENEIKKFGMANAEFLKRSMNMTKIMGLITAFMSFAGGLGGMLVLWLGGWAIINNKITLGDFVAFNGYLAMLIWPTAAIGWVMNVFQVGISAVRRIIQIMDVNPTIKDDGNVKPVGKIQGEVEFRKFNLSYLQNNIKDGGSKLQLKDINLKIHRGEKIGIVGKVGSGKSTLIKAIPRLVELGYGELFIDGHEIHSIPLNNLRKFIGYVAQESFLFSDTIKNNIILGEKNIPETRLNDVARVTGIDTDINSFAKGIDTLVGERGVTLSGGQKQKVTLARALFRNPRILILDDCFSNLDFRTEAEILCELKAAAKDMTVIIVSHRISSIKNLDRIIVLDGGMMVEEGTHSELVSKGGIYSEIYQMQLMEEELENV